MSYSLIILIVFAALIILAFVFFKIQKWISIGILILILGFTAAYLIVPDFQAFVRGKSKELKSDVKDKVIESKDNLEDKVKEKISQ